MGVNGAGGAGGARRASLGSIETTETAGVSGRPTGLTQSTEGVRSRSNSLPPGVGGHPEGAVQGALRGREQAPADPPGAAGGEEPRPRGYDEAGGFHRVLTPEQQLFNQNVEMLPEDIQDYARSFFDRFKPGAAPFTLIESARRVVSLWVNALEPGIPQDNPLYQQGAAHVAVLDGQFNLSERILGARVYGQLEYNLDMKIVNLGDFIGEKLTMNASELSSVEMKQTLFVFAKYQDQIPAPLKESFNAFVDTLTQREEAADMIKALHGEGRLNLGIDYREQLRLESPDLSDLVNLYREELDQIQIG